MTILDKIIQTKYKEVKENKNNTPIHKLEKEALFYRDTISLKESLLDNHKIGIIAEFKRKSPSKGMMNGTVKVEVITQGYVEAGASALSILTDEKYFGGSNQNLRIARANNHCPILRKDFMIDEYQIVESKSIGADAILLIAAVLTKEQTTALSRFAKSLGLDVLFEIHNEKELAQLNPDIDIVGINNRNLKTFEVDINTSLQLYDKIPNEFVKISESGINHPQSIINLKKKGYQGFLVGENFMSNENPVQQCSSFINEIKKTL